MALKRGYAGLIVLIVTLAIIIILLTMEGSPLHLWVGSGPDNSGQVKQQVEQLQTDVDALRSEQQKALEAIDNSTNK